MHEELRAQIAEIAQSLHQPLPRATYRVQFHAGFGFRDATALVPYLQRLGITHLYTSPYLRARSGSTHGYDVADPNALNPELGTEADYNALVAKLQQHGMAQLVDVVPNHMGIGDPGNIRWLDVLENGPASVYASFFDITWNPLKAGMQDQGKLVVPVLGDQYGLVLENGELTVKFDPADPIPTPDGATGGFAAPLYVQYYEHRFPLAPDTYPQILTACYEAMEADTRSSNPDVQELGSILSALRHLPPRGQLSTDEADERDREKSVTKRRLRQLYRQSPAFQGALAAALDAVNGTAAEPASFDRLDALLGEQSYRLAFWRVAAEEINYRRFFDISELAAVRMEIPEVFEETHRLLLKLVGQGKIGGLRIDHPDGLWDPAAYLWRLQRSCFRELFAHHLADGLADADQDRLRQDLEEIFDLEHQRDSHSLLLQPLYVVVEKILARDERLRATWPVHGTTGYDFLNVLNGVFVKRENRGFLDNVYARFTGAPRIPFRDVASSAKKMIMLISLASEVNDLAYRLKELAGSDRRHRDFTLNGLTFVVREIIAALAVYRTYVDPDTGAVTEEDERPLEEAVSEAKRRNPRTDPSIFNYVRDTLLLKDLATLEPERRLDHLRFVGRFQQTTGPVMAKGVEDTAFYTQHRLVSLNDVGGDPGQFGTPLNGFHSFNRAHARDWPASLLATSTHDTKRSEDVRARINVLSELPREWQAAVSRWSRLNGGKRVPVDGRLAPDRNEEYLLYQTLLGVWPLASARSVAHGADCADLKDRICAFMLKAVREAKVNTSWINPNADYEEAVRQFVHAVLTPDARSRNATGATAFLDDFDVLRERVAYFGLFNALSQTVLKLASPGVPDVYQGNEVWDFSLVDPDNRRPVDYQMRAGLLDGVERAVAGAGKATGDAARGRYAADLVSSPTEGRIKLYAIKTLLDIRRHLAPVFADGSYTPVRAEGPRRQNVCAFVRQAAGQPPVIVAAPVLVVSATRGVCTPPVGEEIWGRTRLTHSRALPDTYRNAFTGEILRARQAHGRWVLPLDEVFATFPAAALVAQ